MPSIGPSSPSISKVLLVKHAGTHAASYKTSTVIFIESVQSYMMLSPISSLPAFLTINDWTTPNPEGSIVNSIFPKLSGVRPAVCTANFAVSMCKVIVPPAKLLLP